MNVRPEPEYKGITYPVVPASVYDKVASPSPFTWIWSWHRWRGEQDVWHKEFGNAPDRPVLMRGSLGCLVAKHSWTADHIANGWCYEIAKRYLRRIKYTDLTVNSSKSTVFMWALQNRLMEKWDWRGKGFKISRNFELSNLRSSYVDFWLNGEEIEENFDEVKKDIQFAVVFSQDPTEILQVPGRRLKHLQSDAAVVGHFEFENEIVCNRLKGCVLYEASERKFCAACGCSDNPARLKSSDFKTLQGNGKRSRERNRLWHDDVYKREPTAKFCRDCIITMQKVLDRIDVATLLHRKIMSKLYFHRTKQDEQAKTKTIPPRQASCGIE